MLKSEYNGHLKKICEDLIETSKNGQAEYALSEDAFDNFNRLAEQLKLNRKSILWVYLQKHLDGIVSYLNGHKSQRESVHGRIKDAIVYLTLLDAMIYEENRDERVPIEVNPVEYSKKIGACKDSTCSQPATITGYCKFHNQYAVK